MTRDEIYRTIENHHCSDGNCIFKNPEKNYGMHTNGGCKCAGDYNKKHGVNALIGRLQYRINELESLLNDKGEE